MKLLKTLWEWFDGNKTAIGALLLAIAGSGLFPEHTFFYQLCMYLGALLGGGGLLHKIAKGVHNTGK